MIRLLALCLVAQDPPRDLADLPRTLESWYRITQAGQTTGYLHERIDRLQGLPWRYDYRIRMELEFLADDPVRAERKIPLREEIAAEAYLDDAFAPIYMKASA